MALELARTKDGHPAIQLRQMTYALLPSKAGGLGMFICYPARPPEECVADDFTQMIRTMKDEAEFVAEAQEMALHNREVDMLGRVELRGLIPTPWGGSQYRLRYAEGIESVSTAGHGGFMLSAERNEQVHEAWRSRDGSYEEDCEWAVVALSFPEYFTLREKKLADKSLRNWMPDQYEAVTGKTIQPGESHERDKKAYLAENAARYIVISAVYSRNHSDLVECTATIGGDRSGKPVYFLVPRNEYHTANFGFIIDEAKHPRMDAAGNPVVA